MSGNHNLYCSGNQPDIIELRALATDGRYSTVRVASKELLALIDEIERLRALCASQQADDVQCLGNNGQLQGPGGSLPGPAASES